MYNPGSAGTGSSGILSKLMLRDLILRRKQGEFTLICCSVLILKECLYWLKSAEPVLMYVFKSKSYPNISS